MVRPPRCLGDPPKANVPKDQVRVGMRPEHARQDDHAADGERQEDQRDLRVVARSKRLALQRVVLAPQPHLQSLVDEQPEQRHHGSAGDEHHAEG